MLDLSRRQRPVQTRSSSLTRSAIRPAISSIFATLYVNSHAGKLLKTPREGLLRQDMCALFPVNRTNGLFDKYRKVVLSGERFRRGILHDTDDGKELWLRQRVTKLGDGVAITTSDATEIKASEERYRSLSNFSNSVFENAPYSIIETDANGVIQAINVAAERLNRLYPRRSDW